MCWSHTSWAALSPSQTKKSGFISFITLSRKLFSDIYYFIVMPSTSGKSQLPGYPNFPAASDALAGFPEDCLQQSNPLQFPLVPYLFIAKLTIPQCNCSQCEYQ